MPLFRRKQPARVAALRQLLEKSFPGRRFSDDEIHDIAAKVSEFAVLVIDPEKALRSEATPAQLLFAIAIGNSDICLTARDALQVIAASQATGKG